MSELDVFERSARRHIRNHVMDRGEVPALAAIVSRGWNPRKLRVQMSLHLLPDSLGVKAQLQQMIRENSSRYAGWCARVDHEDGHVLLFVGDGRSRARAVGCAVHGRARANMVGRGRTSGRARSSSL